ncbi:ABC transporter substrate-binding protein [Nonomuraea sp. NPDC050643]|uniref:ABC transporter substrate-binding protein n=1 Tax=Nonomuraea sp. NPDC050643 TaxID=3155660 RepID=UPI0033F6671E
MRAWRPVLVFTVLSVALAGCGSADNTSGSTGTTATTAAASAAPSGPWSFTDGSGKVIKADKTPTRIIAHAGEAAALMSFGIKPVGIYSDESVKTDANLKDLDLTGIEILGQEWGKIDVEKAASLRPDLIVGDWWPAEKAHSGLEEGVDEKSKKLAELAPVVGVSQGKSIVDLAKGYEDLAKSLGANVDSPEIAVNKKRFDEAVVKFKEAIAAKSGLTVAAMSPADDKVYVANPEYAPELLDFQRWGMKVITPDTPDPGFPYWENLSWENADKYQPDLILFDGRTFKPTSNDEWAKKQPTWFRIKAAKAGAVVSWPAYWLHTYGHFATELDKLTTAIKAADPNIGD